MTIYETLLARGYFPKELPPSFFTEQFARYATTKKGRQILSAYKPSHNFTEVATYRLALPRRQRRDLGLVHPASFSVLASLTAKHFRRLLKKAARSRFSRSRPIFVTDEYRALRTMFKPSNLARERAIVRAGGSYLVKADINHFYSSLYTHAIGWAIDSKLRQKLHWQNKNLLGKKLDQAVMNLQGKVSQGVPIGNDISFLMAEIVLAQVDRNLKVPAERAYRWFDDYEISCDTLEEAEKVLSRLTREFRRFRLRTNVSKTAIHALPIPVQEEWQQILNAASRGLLRRPDAFVSFFDTAFRLRAADSDSPVLTYALGLLFRLSSPEPQVAGVVQSGITQALLSEPGVAQKAFALLSFWILNGFEIDRPLIARTIDKILEKHRASGVTSDVSWALAFCLDHHLSLSARAGELLSSCDDDCIAIQSLHCSKAGLLPKGFTSKKLSVLIKDVDLDGEHWLLGYEAARQGFLQGSLNVVNANPLFRDFLQRGVAFYRTKLPKYSMVLHPGGAPEWTIRLWLDVLQARREVPEELAGHARKLGVVKLIAEDLEKVDRGDKSRDETIAALLDSQSAELLDLFAGTEPYS